MLPTMTLMSETKSSSLAEPLPRATDQTNLTLLSYTVPWPRSSLLAFLHQAGHAPRVYWENEQLDLGLAGYGAALTLQAHDQSRFESIQCQAPGSLSRPFCCLPTRRPTLAPGCLVALLFRSGTGCRGCGRLFRRPALCCPVTN